VVAAHGIDVVRQRGGAADVEHVAAGAEADPHLLEGRVAGDAVGEEAAGVGRRVGGERGAGEPVGAAGGVAGVIDVQLIAAAGAAVDGEGAVDGAEVAGAVGEVGGLVADGDDVVAAGGVGGVVAVDGQADRAGQGQDVEDVTRVVGGGDVVAVE